MVTTDEQADRVTRARENSQHLRMLLSRRDPDFFNALRAAERLIELDLSGMSQGGKRDDQRDSALSL